LATIAQSLKMLVGVSKAMSGVDRQLSTFRKSVTIFREAVEQSVRLKIDVKGNESSLGFAEPKVERIQANMFINPSQLAQTVSFIRNQIEQGIGQHANLAQGNLVSMFRSLAQSVDHANQQLRIAVNWVDQLRTTVARPLILNLDVKRFKAVLSQVEKSVQGIKLGLNIDGNQVTKTAIKMRSLIGKYISVTTSSVQIKLSSSSQTTINSLGKSISQLSTMSMEINKASSQFSYLGLGRSHSTLDKSDCMGSNNGGKDDCGSQKGTSEKNNVWSKGLEQLKSSLQNIFNVDQFRALISAGMKATDQIVNIQSNLNSINDGMQTTDALQKKIFAAATRSGSGFQQMAATVSEVYLSSPGMFASNDETIQFVEVAQKAFQLNGQSPSDQAAGMNVIGDVMKRGAMSQEDFTSIMTTAPDIADAIASFTGKSKSELQQLAAEGQLTSSILKNGLLSATDAINEKFSSLPMTFASIGEIAKNVIFLTIGPALESIASKITEAFESGSLNRFIYMVAEGFNIIASVGMWAFDLIINNLDIVKNVLAALGIAALAVGVYMLISWLMSIGPMLLIIGVIFLIISILNMFGVTTEQIIGFVAGLFMMLFGAIWNAVAVVWNFLLSFAEFLVNLFIDPVYTIQKLFYDLSMYFFQTMHNMLVAAETFANGFMSVIVDAINKGLEKFNEMLAGVSKWFGKSWGPIELLTNEDSHTLSDKVSGIMNSIPEPISNKDLFNLDKYRMGEKDLGDMFSTGYDAGSKMFGKENNFLDNLTGGNAYKGGPFTGFAPTNHPASNDIANVDRVGEIGSIQNSVDISSEDLKMMRELAEMNNIQNFVSLTPSINFGDMHVRQDSDIDIIVAKISDRLNQDISTSVDAVYR